MPLYNPVPTASGSVAGLVKLPAASASFQPSNPTGTVSLNTLVMMGLGSTVVYTPASTGIVIVTLGGWTNIATAANIITAGARYGTVAGPATTVASGSNGSAQISTIASWAQPSAGVLDVASTAGYAASGTIWVATNGQAAQISYTSITGGGTPSFNGCAFVAGAGTATIATGNAVTGSPQNGAALVGTRFGSNADLPHSPPAAGTKDMYIAFPDRLALAAGTQYWFDIALSTNNASDAVTIVSVSAVLAEQLA